MSTVKIKFNPLLTKDVYYNANLDSYLLYLGKHNNNILAFNIDADQFVVLALTADETPGTPFRPAYVEDYDTVMGKQWPSSTVLDYDLLYDTIEDHIANFMKSEEDDDDDQD